MKEGGSINKKITPGIDQNFYLSTEDYDHNKKKLLKSTDTYIYEYIESNAK